jgi:hypothetical protein
VPPGDSVLVFGGCATRWGHFSPSRKIWGGTERDKVLSVMM